MKFRFHDHFSLLQGWLLKAIHGVRQLFWVVEQPTSSKMFQMPTLKPWLSLWQMLLTTTWMGCFGHPLQKGTKLMSNLASCSKFLCSIATLSSFMLVSLVWAVSAIFSNSVRVQFDIRWNLWTFSVSDVANDINGSRMVPCRLKRTMTQKIKDKIAKRQAEANSRALARGEKEQCFYWTGFSDLRNVWVCVWYCEILMIFMGWRNMGGAWKSILKFGFCGLSPG